MLCVLFLRSISFINPYLCWVICNEHYARIWMLYASDYIIISFYHLCNTNCVVTHSPFVMKPLIFEYGCEWFGEVTSAFLCVILRFKFLFHFKSLSLVGFQVGCVFLTLQEVLLLEEDMKALEEMYPQGEKVMKHILMCWPAYFLNLIVS